MRLTCLFSEYMQRVVVDAGNKGISLNLKELAAYKNLLFTLALRDIKVRYAQTFLGLVWAAIQPLSTLLIFTLVFSKVARVDTGSIPYPVFAIVGMSAWTYFSFVMSQAGTSIIGAQNMISKIYFPRLIIPFSKALVGLIDFGISFSFIIILMVMYQVPPSPNVVWLPVFILFALIAGLTIGIWLSALTVRYRDFQHIVPFLVQIGLYATPVAYPASLVPEQYRVVYFLNPMAGVVEGFRWSLVGGEIPGTMTLASLLLLLVLFVAGLFYFRKVERVMADIV
jgi:lipopolysaccharide transport system permease protein